MRKTKVVEPEVIKPEVIKPGFSSGVDAGVDMESVSSILVVAKEENLLEQEKTLRGKIRDAEKTLVAAAKRVTAVAEKLAKASISAAKISKVVSSLKDIGFVKGLEVRSAYSGLSEGNVNCAIEVGPVQGNGNYYKLTTNYLVKPNAALKKEMKSEDVASKAKSKLDKELMDVLRDLQNMSRHERRARAAVAVTNLQQTKEGKKFLGDMTSNLKALPSLGGK